jgi:uroporphyrinogen decarboxylase
MRRLCYSQPELAHALLGRIAAAVLASLRAQIGAGASAIQLFDTWAGSLTPALFAEFSLPAIRTIMDGLADLGVPRILYVGDTGHYLHLLAHAAADVISVDWRISLDQASQRLGSNSALQGNLDPCALYLDAAGLRRQVSGVLDSARGLRSHIFNLGHGILPDVPPDNVAVLVDAVHSLSQRREES